MATNEDTDFTTLALAYLAERESGDGDTLRRYMSRYPDYAKELMRLTFEAEAEGCSGTGVQGYRGTEDIPAYLLDALKADARAALGIEEAALHSIIDYAQQHAGLSPRTLAKALDISVDVLALLNERRIAAETIVPSFMERLSEVIGAPMRALQTYLAGPQLASARVAFHAPRGHKAIEKLTFTEAISSSTLMTDEQKGRWLSD